MRRQIGRVWTAALYVVRALGARPFRLGLGRVRLLPRPLGQRVLDPHQDLVRVQWLPHIIKRPFSHQVHGGTDVGITRDDDHCRITRDPFDVLEHFHTVGIRQPVVAKHQIVVLLFQQVLGGGSPLGGIHPEPLLGEEAG